MTISDTTSYVTVSLEATRFVSEGGSITYTATLTHPADTNSPVTVYLDIKDEHGQPVTISIAAGETTGTVAVAAPSDDVYQDSSIVSASITDAVGGNFEYIIDDRTPKITFVGDTQDTTTATLSVDQTAIDEDGASLIYTVTLNNAAAEDMTVTLSNGATVFIAKDAFAGSSAPVAVAADSDIYKEADTQIDVSITDVTANSFEALDTTTNGSVSTTVSDSIDVVSAVIEGPAEAVLEGENVEFTVKLVDENGLPITVTQATEITVSFTNGTAENGDYSATTQTVTIQPGSSSAVVTVATNVDADHNNETFTANIDSVQDRNEFESIVVGQQNSAQAAIEEAPLSESSSITMNEDAVYTYKQADFNFTDVDGDALTAIRIESLPEMGDLYYNGIIVTAAGLEIDAANIGLLTFKPDADDSGSDQYSDNGADKAGVGEQHTDYANFTFSVKTDDYWSSNTATTTIDVNAVADEPTLSVTSESTVISQSITVDNVTDTTSGFNVSAFNGDGSLSTISSNNWPGGFGVTGAASGADSELGGAEKLVVTFDNDISSVDVAFAWKAPGENAFYTFYKDGVVVGTGTSVGGSDGVDPAVTLKPDNGAQFDQVVFSAPRSGDDYLINSITYDKAVIETGPIVIDEEDSVALNIDAVLTDTDGSETLAVVLNDIPVGFTLSDGTHSFTADASTTSIDISDWSLDNLTLQTTNIAATTSYILNVVATATEYSNNDSSSKSFPIELTVNNIEVPTAPTISAAETSTVSEEGLAALGAIADSSGSSDTTNAVVSNGQFSVADVNGDTLTVTLNTPAGTYTSGGDNISWTLSNSNHTLTGSTANGEVLKVEINDDGSYTTTLLGSIDHTDATTEDTLALAIGVTVSDGSLSSQSTLNVVIEDDSVQVADSTNNIHLQAVNTNVQLVLDFSGSMRGAALDIMKEAVSNMLSEYDSLGNVKVNIVTFSSSADTHVNGWMSVADAKSYVDGLTDSNMGGSTNYDAALLETMDSFGAGGSIVNAQNVSYFLTDGAPSGSSGIQSGEEATWVNFLNTNNINSFSFAMGSGASQSNIDPIAYDGSASPSSNTEGVVVANISELPPILRDTVNGENLGQLTQGSVGNIGDAVGFGADGNGYIETISIDGATYTYNAAQNTISTVGTNNASFDSASHILTIETALDGKFAVNMLDGTYEYTASGKQTTSDEKITYTAVDADGDSDRAVLTIDILPAAAAPDPVYSPDADVIKTYQNTPYDGISTGNGNDILTISKSITRDISTSDGNDTISAGGHIYNGAVINMGAGNDTLNIQKSMSSDVYIKGAGTIDMGSGEDTIVFAQASSSEFTYSIDNSGVLHIEHKTNSRISLYVENVEHIYFGGDNKTFDVGTAPVQQGVFIDGIVSGLSYKTSSGMTGLTGENGEFNYLAGDTVTFTIGNIVLGSMDTAHMQDEQLFLQDLANVARTDVNDEYVENMAVLLQSLDADGDAYNGIVITQAMRDAFSDNDFDLATISEQDLVTIIEQTGHTALSEDAAMEHVQDMLELHAGMDGAEFDQRVLDDSLSIDNDTLIAGSDNDYLIGETGADTFVWLDDDIDGGTDHIQDFNISEGDKLDLSDLLHVKLGDTLDDYLNFSSDGTNTTIDVFVDGDAADAGAASQTIVLDGVDLGSNDVSIINNLFDNNNSGPLIISDVAVDEVTHMITEIPDDHT
ncbi:immunoglobulin-like domain-containing protein [Psychromonas aquimarina]|uniref:immunoglobulin-like domain-containing protein n=1 Tax=Psychromonas aquimarina TaxID=444919 RepID=UPI0003FCEFCA|nr:immunoglobulin-like domain-containing protein [Psychromonas aquimarina]